jgi:nicotinate-nucleotide pyrophosphorylase (carboxylating)
MREQDFLPLIELALREDLGELGDVTSRAVVPDETCAMILWSKDEGILAGEEVFSRVFEQVDPSIEVSFLRHDGDRLCKGDKVAVLKGRAHQLLSGERTAINFISYLSGIATKTHRLVSLAGKSGRAVVLDTRKTLPGFRALSKYAVTVGGGRNHRQGLFDMVLIKDNHIDAAGSISVAVKRVREMWGSQFTVEVESRSLDEVTQALEAGADMVMLDNMEPGMIRDAVRMIGGRARTEASGNVDEEKIGPVSAAGVDFISVGGITHSVTGFDFSLKVDLMERG